MSELDTPTRGGDGPACRGSSSATRTRREALRRGVAGWVCNRGDGAVEAVFEGPAGRRERPGRLLLPRPAGRLGGRAWTYATRRPRGCAGSRCGSGGRPRALRRRSRTFDIYLMYNVRRVGGPGRLSRRSGAFVTPVTHRSVGPWEPRRRARQRRITGDGGDLGRRRRCWAASRCCASPAGAGLRVALPVRIDRAPASGAGGGVERPSGGGIYVHVAGAVRQPGLRAAATTGARVAEAVERAGGPGPRADLAGVNLAARLEDGQQVIVPVRGAGGAAAPRPGAGCAGAGRQRGPARQRRRAQAEPRERQPSSSSTRSTASARPWPSESSSTARSTAASARLAELREVEGIGEKRFEGLARGAAAVSGGADGRAARRRRRAARSALTALAPACAARRARRRSRARRPWHVSVAALGAGLALAQTAPAVALLAAAALGRPAGLRPVRPARGLRRRAASSPESRPATCGCPRSIAPAERIRDGDPLAARAYLLTPPATGPLRLLGRGSDRATAALHGARLLARAARWSPLPRSLEVGDELALAGTLRALRPGARAAPRPARAARRSTTPHTCAGAASRPSSCSTARARPAVGAAASPARSTACASGPSARWPPG